MRDKRVVKLPKCNYCHEPAIYDAPTNLTGQWAYMCATCSIKHCSNLAIGTHFIVGIAPPVKSVAQQAFRLSAEECECPECGEIRAVEPDADYEFDCEGCGIKLKVCDSLEDTRWMENPDDSDE